MIIAGLAKLSLVDFPGRTACTVFLGGCNLRCPWCHNSELLKDPPRLMETGDLLAFLASRRGLLDGVCVSGGEPCLNPDLPALLRSLREMGFAVKLDTNGTRPQLLADVLAEGLVDYAAVDIKNAPGRWAETVGLPGYSPLPVLTSIRRLFQNGIDFELRTTVVRPFHDRGAIEGIRDLLHPLTEQAGRPVPHYFLQPFVDRDTVPYAGFSAPPETDLRDWLAILSEIASETALRGV